MLISSKIFGHCEQHPYSHNSLHKISVAKFNWQSGGFRWPMNVPTGISIGMHGLTYILSNSNVKKDKRSVTQFVSPEGSSTTELFHFRRTIWNYNSLYLTKQSPMAIHLHDGKPICGWFESYQNRTRSALSNHTARAWPSGTKQMQTRKLQQCWRTIAKIYK